MGFFGLRSIIGCGKEHLFIYFYFDASTFPECSPDQYGGEVGV